MEKPYHRDEKVLSGDKNPAAIYEAVGSALTTWENLEQSLVQLFSILMMGNIFSCQRIYGSIVSHRGRTDLIVAASEIFFFNYPETHKRMIKFIENINHYSNRRNEIAHGQVVDFMGDIEKDGYYLLPSNYSRKHRSVLYDEPAYMYNSTQIKHYDEEFDRVTFAIYRKIDAICRWANKKTKKEIPPVSLYKQNPLGAQSISLPSKY